MSRQTERNPPHSQHKREHPLTELELRPGYAYQGAWFICIAAWLIVLIPVVVAGAFGIVQFTFMIIALATHAAISHLKEPRFLKVGIEGITFGKDNKRKRHILWGSIKEIRHGNRLVITWGFVQAYGYELVVVGTTGRRETIRVDESLYTTKAGSMRNIASYISVIARDKGIPIVRYRDPALSKRNAGE